MIFCFITSKHLRLLLGMLLLSLVSFPLYGQNSSILGTVVDSISSKPLYLANVIIKNENTSNYLQGTTTSENGKFEFCNLKSGKYFITISFIGYNTQIFVIKLNENEKKNLCDIRLVVMPFQLSEIQISYKPLIDFGDDGNVTLNIDMMGDVGNRSVADVIQSIPGLYFDHNGNLHYTGYFGFETLINGKRLGSNIMMMNTNEERMYYKLKQIPAKYIKSVEVLPEPKGKYGFFTPILNLITNGDLRDFHDVSTEVGIKNKYGFSAGLSKINKKITVSSDIGFKRPVDYSSKNEFHTNKIDSDRSYSWFNLIKNSKPEGNIKLSSSYDFKIGHELGVIFSNRFSNDIQNLHQSLVYENGNILDIVENRRNKPRSNQLDITYKNIFNHEVNKTLLLSANASLNSSKANATQKDSYEVFGEIIKQFQSSNISKGKRANLNLYFNNSKSRLRYNISGKIDIEQATEISKREQLNVLGDWEELPNFKNEISSIQILSAFSVGFNYRFGKDRAKRNLFESSITENYSWKKIENNVLRNSQSDNWFRTSVTTKFRSNFKTYGNIFLGAIGNIRWPSMTELIGSPFYIDEKNMTIGNSALKPESSYQISSSIAWNPQNVLVVSLNQDNAPNYGFFFNGKYSISNDRIVPSYSLDESGVMIQSYTNSTNYKAISVGGNFYWNPIHWINLNYGGTYLFDSYKEHLMKGNFNGSWILNTGIILKLKKNITLNAKYRFYSSQIEFQKKISEFHDGSVSLAGFAFNGKAYLSIEAVNLYYGNGRKTEVWGNGFRTITYSFKESPIFWVHLSMKFFKFLKK